jgi:hypothetical protein
MIPEAPKAHQATSMVAYVGSLYRTCLHRFRDAALLVGADLRQWPAIDAFMSTEVDLAPFSPFWGRVCDRYNCDICDPQRDLLRRSAPVEESFSQFIHWRLWRMLASENECVRNVLRGAGVLPCNHEFDAVRALIVYIDGLTFTVDMRPLDPGYLND